MRSSRLLALLIALTISSIALAEDPPQLQVIRTPGAAIAVSKDGKLAIGAHQTSPIRLLDFAANEIWSFDNGQGACTSIDLTGDGRLLAIVRDSLEPKENILSVWDVNAKEKMWETPDGVFWVHFSPDRTMIAAGRRGAVRFYNSKIGTVVKDLPAHGDSNVAFGEYSGSGKMMVTAGDDDHKVILWVVSTGENKNSFTLKGEPISALAISDDGELVAVAQGTALSLIDSKTNELKWSKTIANEPIRALSFRPKSIQVAAGGLDGAVRIWSGVTGEQLDEITPNQGMIQALKYSTDGLVLFVGTSQMTLKYSAKPSSEPDEVRAEVKGN